MKRFVKLTSFILSLLITLSLFGCAPGEPLDTGEGLSFSPFNYFVSNNELCATPMTIEASIKLDSNYKSKAGVILGNYGGGNPSFNLEIFERGKPRLYYVDENNETHAFTFDYNVAKSEWIHLAITWDYTTAKLYINGKFEEKAFLSIDQTPNITTPYVLGGDLRAGNTQYFKGKIRSLAIFSSVRSDSEISNDSKALNYDIESLCAYYKLSGQDQATTISDLSQNGKDLTIKTDWLDSYTPPTEYDFSFMIIGDTQIVTYHYPDKLKNIYDYVINNATSKKVKHVFGLGDITDDDLPREWQTAYAQISRMDGVVNYSLIRGNHDIYSANKTLSIPSLYDNYLGAQGSVYEKQYIDCYKGYSDPTFKARNTVHTFSSSTRDYLVIALDFGANDDILAWAGSVCDAYPNHNVIVTTHAYLASNGAYYTSAMGTPATRDYGQSANNGDHMWDEFVSKHKNIVMVLCGHSSSSDIILRQSTGDNGNVVNELLIDPQGLDSAFGGMGMVATFYVSADGKSMTTDFYSTIHNKYYRQKSHFTFNVETIDRAE